MGKKTLIYVLLSIALFTTTGLKAQECEWLEVAGNPNSAEILRSSTVNDSDAIIMVGNFNANFTIGSTTLTATNSINNGFIINYAKDGSFQWAKQSFNSLSNSVDFMDVKTDKANNIYVVGTYRDSLNFGNGVYVKKPVTGTANRIFLIKYNASAQPQWTRDIGGTSSNTVHNPRITVDNDNLLVTFNFLNSVMFEGSTQTITSNGAMDIGIVKYTKNGAYINSGKFGGSGSETNSAADVDSTGNIFILGNSQGNFSFGSQSLADTGELILKVDSSLNPIVGSKAKTNRNSFGITAIPSGGCIVVGNYFGSSVSFGGNSLTLSGSVNIYNHIVFYDRNLNAVWAKSDSPIGGVAFPQGGVTIRNNYIYFGGNLQAGDTKFGNSVLTWTPSSFNMYLVKMDTLGNFLWAFSSGASNGGSSAVQKVGADLDGNGIIAGIHTKSVKVFNLSASGGTGQDIFLAKITDYSITRGNVNPGPYCAGDSFKIPYTKTGRYDTGNVFIAQLSDSAGNFEGGERELGRVTDTAGGEVKGQLPLFDVATTNKYRIRILSTKPVVQSFFRRDTLRLLIYSKDTANAGPDRLVCRGEPIRLGTTGGSKWQWSPATFMPNKADTANRQPLIVPDSALQYRIIISDSSGCGLTDTDYVNITLRPDLDIQVAGPTAVCRGQVVTLRAKPTGGDSSYYYQWLTVGIAGVPITTDSLVVSPDTTTTYRLILGDSCTAKNDTVFFTLTIDTVLKVFVINDTKICKGTKNFPLRAWGSGCDTSQYKFLWTDVADTSTLLGNSSQLLISPEITTNYRVILQDTGTMLSDTAFVKISVDNIFISTVTKNTTICKGQSLVLEAGAVSCDTSQLGFVWDNGLDTTKTNTVTPNITTTYTVIVTNKYNGLKDTASVTVTVRPPLKVTVNADTTICLGQSAELRAINSGGDSSGYVLNWSEVGSQWSVVGKTTMVSPTKTTTYRALLTDGCTVLGDSAEITITVRDSLKITVNADTTICVGESVELRAIGQGGNSPSRSVLWTVVGGPWTQNSPQTTVTPAQTTTYRAVLSDGCTTPNDSAEVTITVRPPLKVTVNGKTDACVGDTVILTAQATGGDSTNYNYLWKLPDNSTQTTPSISVKPTTTSSYSIIVGDNCSTPGFDSVIHTINIPTPISISTNNDTTICDGWSVPLSVTITGGVPANYKTIWEELSSGFTDTNSAIVVKPTSNTQYSISVGDNCSFPKKDTVNITVLPSPNADFSLQNNIGCEPLLVTPQDLSQNHDTIFNVWKTNATLKEGKQPPLLYPQAGIYDVALVVKNTLGCADSISKTGAVVVYPKPISNFRVNPAIKQVEEEITFNNLSSGAINYTWFLGENDSILIQDKSSITKIYKDTGNYQIQLIAKTQNNCEDTATTYITLVDLFTVVIPNAFTPNGDFLNDIFTPINTGTLAYKMTFFNRWGEVIYYCECSSGCPNPCTWDGNYRGIPLPEGTYSYILTLEAQTRTKRTIMGSVVLVR